MVLIFFVRHKNLLLLFFLIVIGLFLRFYNLNWGAPFYFHPDERNIASSVSQLYFPNQMNPKFFAYGSFPIYLTYFTGVKLNMFAHYGSLLAHYLRGISIDSPDSVFRVQFEQAIIITRIFSAILSTLLIPLMYAVGKKIQGEKTGILAAFFTTFSVAFIQFAHFGTFEMWLTFLGALFFYCCLQIVHNVKRKNLAFTGILLGLLCAVKVSSLALLPFPFMAIIAGYLTKTSSIKNLITLSTLLKLFLSFVLVLFASIFVYVASSPFVFLDQKSFWSSMKYESEVAFGTLSVFYTGQFTESIPVVFQFLHVTPFLLNPVMTIIFIPAILYFVLLLYKKKSLSFMFVLGFYLVIFLSQAFFYAKWVRYLVPTIPFAYLIFSVLLVHFWERYKKIHEASLLLYSLILFSCILFSISYFTTVFVKGDTRVAANQWAEKNIPSQAKILSEVYDMGIVPFNSNFHSISLHNFYDLEVSSMNNKEDFILLLKDYDYIILPSQRIIKSRLLFPNKFPKGNSFYTMLFTEELGFREIYRTPCDMLCRATYFGDPVFSFEETASVFDRPTVFIFKRKDLQ